MDEKVFYESDSVTVTNTRFLVDGQTYALASVNSVKVDTKDLTHSNAPAISLISIGVIWLWIAISNNASLGFFWFFSYGVPIVLGVAGAMALESTKKKYEHTLILTTSSGETSALKGNNWQNIRAIETALSDAIIYRG